MISFIVKRILRIIFKDKGTHKFGEVCLPIGVLIVSCICTPLLLAFSILCLVLGNIIWGAMLFFILSLLSAMFAVAYFNMRITYTNDCYIAHSFWGKKRTFKYDQITAIKRHPAEFKLYMGNKEICVEYLLIGSHDFLNHVEQKYKEVHDGKEIPIASQKENDIFLGNSSDKGVSFIIGYSIGFAVIAGMFGFFLSELIKALLNNTSIPTGFLIFVILLLLSFILWIVYGILAIIAGRNPNKYKKIVTLIFQKGYIDTNNRNRRK